MLERACLDARITAIHLIWDLDRVREARPSRLILLKPRNQLRR